MPLFPLRKKYSDRVATLLPDGRVEVDGVAFAGPAEAATAIAGKRISGWWFFLTDKDSQRSLRDVRREYVEAMALDAEDDEPDYDGDDEEVQVAERINAQEVVAIGDRSRRAVMFRPQQAHSRFNIASFAAALWRGGSDAVGLVPG